MQALVRELSEEDHNQNPSHIHTLPVQNVPALGVWSASSCFHATPKHKQTAIRPCEFTVF